MILAEGAMKCLNLPLTFVSEIYFYVTILTLVVLVFLGSIRFSD